MDRDSSELVWSRDSRRRSEISKSSRLGRIIDFDEVHKVIGGLCIVL